MLLGPRTTALIPRQTLYFRPLDSSAFVFNPNRSCRGWGLGDGRREGFCGGLDDPPSGNLLIPAGTPAGLCAKSPHRSPSRRRGGGGGGRKKEGGGGGVYRPLRDLKERGDSVSSQPGPVLLHSV